MNLKTVFPWYSKNYYIRRTAWTYVVVPGCIRWRIVVWFSVGKPRKKAEERKWKTTNQPFGHSATLVSTSLAVVDTSLNLFLFDRCIFALINFELARTIGSRLVCLEVNDLKWKWAYPFHLKSIFISAWPGFDSISTNDFYSSFPRRVGLCKLS